MFLLLHYILLRNYQQNVMLHIYHLITHQLLHNPFFISNNCPPADLEAISAKSISSARPCILAIMGSNDLPNCILWLVRAFPVSGLTNSSQCSVPPFLCHHLKSQTFLLFLIIDILLDYYHLHSFHVYILHYHYH